MAEQLKVTTMSACRAPSPRVIFYVMDILSQSTKTATVITRVCKLTLAITKK